MADRIPGKTEQRFLNRSRIDVTGKQGPGIRHGRLAGVLLCRPRAAPQSMASAPLGLDLHDRDFEPPVRVGAVHAADDGHPRGESDEHPDHVFHSDRRADVSFSCSGPSGRQVRSAPAAVDRSALHRIELDPRGQGDDGDGPLPHLRTAGWNRDRNHLHRGGGSHGAVVSGQARSRDRPRRRRLRRRRDPDDVSDRGDDASVGLPACPVAVRRHLRRGRVPRGARFETSRSRLAGARFRAHRARDRCCGKAHETSARRRC